MEMHRRAFLSYSHADADYAKKIGESLRDNGIDVWLDAWEITPGDSIVQKIFSEGLANCEAFLILLSKDSVTSAWVREELDFAMIKKIEGVTRIIPLIEEQCDVPPPLRSLLWVDLSADFERGIREVVKAIHGVIERPAIGDLPDYIRELSQSVGGLTREASTLGRTLALDEQDETKYQRIYRAQELQQLAAQLTIDELNDVVEELHDYGLVESRRVLGTKPFRFQSIEPTYALFLHFKDEGLPYDPANDLAVVANTLASSENGLENAALTEKTGVPPLRLNRAVAYLDDNGIVSVIRTAGTAPYDFRLVRPTSATRRFAREVCK